MPSRPPFPSASQKIILYLISRSSRSGFLFRLPFRKIKPWMDMNMSMSLNANRSCSTKVEQRMSGWREQPSLRALRVSRISSDQRFATPSTREKNAESQISRIPSRDKVVIVIVKVSKPGKPFCYLCAGAQNQGLPSTLLKSFRLEKNRQILPVYLFQSPMTLFCTPLILIINIHPIIPTPTAQ